MAKISTKKKLLMQIFNNTNDTDDKSLDKREILILMTKNLTMNNFKKTTQNDKKLIKQWRNATT